MPNLCGNSRPNQPLKFTQVCLLSKSVGACGLSLTEADRLLIVEPEWNPATDSQAAGHVYRPGQQFAREVQRLVVAGTFEEKVLARQLSKANRSMGSDSLMPSLVEADLFREEPVRAGMPPTIWCELAGSKDTAYAGGQSWHGFWKDDLDAFIMQAGIPAPQDLRMPTFAKTVIKPKGSKRSRDDQARNVEGNDPMRKRLRRRQRL